MHTTCRFDPNLVRNIYCAGRNFVAHAKELNNAPAREEPFFFLKPTSSMVLPPGPIRIPAGAVLHHEVELGVVIKNQIDHPLLSEREAMQQVLGYCTVIDITARNWQDAAKKKSLPWTLAKGGRTFLPIAGEIVIPSDLTADVELELKINGETRQHGSTRDMIHSVPQLLMYLSRFHTLLPNDLVLTGTPSGVGPITSGDSIEITAFGRCSRFDVV